MKLYRILASVLAIGIAAGSPARGQDIVINELMYNPSSANPAEEWIELYNRGTNDVNLTGWRFADGVRFMFPNVTIPAGGYLVVAAETETFESLYPSVGNFVGGWLDALSNNGEGVELQDAAGQRIDRVRYATEGSWGVRRRLPDPNTGTPGWEWTADHDGIGKSAELINAALSNDSGQNWAPSGPVGGTPGVANSALAANIAPMILDVSHFPIVPSSAASVTISARIIDEQTSGPTVRLFHRLATNTPPVPFAAFSSSDMFDDGAHNDGAANDGLYGAVLPALPDRHVVEFYIQASDSASNTRTYPAPAINQLGQAVQTVNMVYQVDDSVYEGTQPFYRVILTEAERLELQNINRQSDAEMNCTFVTVDGIETQVRHNCGIRIRGAGSRGAAVPNYRLNIPNDDLWKGLEAINLNAQFPHAQLVGAAVAQKVGMAAADTRAVQVRVNGRNLAGAGSPQFGSYAAVEPINADFAENHFPHDPDGNVYRASSGPHFADLSYRSDAASLRAAGYSKTSNTSEDDWSDLINLTFVLNNTPDATYTAAVQQVANVRQWMRYFAVITMMGYGETSLGTGEGDDYAMYRGINDQRFLLLAHDFDTIFGQGGGGAIGQNIFLAADASDQPAVARFLLWPDFLPLYYEELLRMSDTTFAAQELFPIFERFLQGWVPEATITAMKVFATNRTAFVRSQIPLNLTVTTNNLRVVNGYFTTTNSTIALNGLGNVIQTRSIRVNGAPAAWQPMGGRWTNLVSLLPGINRVLVQAFDASGAEFQRTFIDIVYDDATVGVIPTTISANTTLTAAGGPYEVTTTITVAAGATLTIEPGTTIYFAQGTGFNINGTLIAEGTETQRIRLTRAPGTTAMWAGIRFSNSTNDNRITYADMEFAATADPIALINSTLLINNVTWSGTTRTIIDLNNSSLICRNSVFPTIANNETIHGVGMPPNGYVIIESNRFGGTTGYSDIIDFTGGRRPGPILQVLNNIFNGGSDDGLDLDGTDAHIEGNLFQHIHQDDPGRDSAAHAIATDFDAQITVVRNIFYDNDHAILLKNGSFLTAENNTFVNCTAAAISFDETNRTVNPGRGAYIDGCIFWNNAALFRHLYINHPVETNTDLTVVRSLTQGTNHPGIGNINADPLFVNYANDFRLRAGSPAIGAGPNGLDMGAHVPGGASISGEPPALTPRTSAILTVGGPGITHYRYRINSEPFGAEEIISQPISLSGLANGTYRVSVIGKNSAGVWQDPMNATVSKQWSVNSSVSGLRINEVLARNDTAVPVGGEFPDLIELHNSGTTSVSLAGMGITDDPAEPFKYTFAPGASLGAGQYLVLYADNATGPGIHLGFALNQNGDQLLLYRPTGTVLDRVSFGPQMADHSVGRHADNNSWGLTRPTFGAANIGLAAGDTRALKINEWLASPGGLLRDDFVELYNTLPVPVNFGGAYLSDAPQHAPTRHLVAPLSFVPPRGFVALIADGNTNQGSEHLNFRLSGDQGEIALFASDLTLVDCIVYGPQVSGIAEGRIPSGANNFGRIDPPTPGGPNPGSIVVATNLVVSLSSLASDWRYEATGTDLGTAWRQPAYDDSAWPVGPALLGVEESALPPPGIRTPLSLFASGGQRIVTYYFRQTLVLTSNLTDFRISANTVIDDGAVIYINGQEVQRIRMPSGLITYDTQASPPSVNNASLESWMLPRTNLVVGANVIAVEVHQASLPSSDIVFGLALEASRSFTNTLAAPIALNEVMANNASVVFAGQTNITDWIELLNSSTNAVDMSDMSLSDNSSEPRRWVFPAGVTIPAGGYLLVRCDSTQPRSTNNVGVLNTGFGLNADAGDEVYLFDNFSRGGGLLNSVVFGIQAADYSIGRVPNATGQWRLNLPTPGSVNVPAVLGTPMTLKINEWLARPSGNDEDFFEIYNPNNQPVHLGGLGLSDVGDPDQRRIPNLSFIGTGPDGFVRFVADNNASAGADHVNFRLNADGEVIGLFAVNGVQIDAISFGAQQSGVSEGRFPDGAPTIERFPGTGTPGRSNLRPIMDIVISEVLTHTDAPLEDAIELQNISSGSIDISGWWLSDQKNDPKKFRIAQGTVIEPGGFVVFYEYQFNPAPGIYPSFSLSSMRGDEVYLFTANASGELTGFRTGEDFGAAANGVSFGRHQTSVGFDFTALSARTFGQDNPTSTNQFRMGAGKTNASPKVGPIVINEIMYHPPDIGTNDNFGDEFIELRNIATTNVALFDLGHPTNTWRLRDAVDFNFPQGVSVPAGAYILVVSFSPTNAAVSNAFRSRYALGPSVPIYGPYEGRLDNGGENVELYRPDAPQLPGTPDAGFVPYIEVDRVKYSDSNPWPSAADGYTNGVGASLQRRNGANYGNDPVNWLAGAPTPGAATGSALVATPSITAQPASQTVPLNGSATFTVTANGAAPLSYQWRLNGVNISAATGSSFTVTNARLADAGGYSVRVINSAGTAISATAVLTVQAPPVITQQPQSRSVAEGSTAIFTVTAQGTPPLSYQWRHDGAPLPGATSATLMVSNVQAAAEGGYTALVSNNFGSVTSAVANLSISAAPQITAQPRGTNVFVGATVTFSVTVSGSPPLVYQWRYNDVDIPGATGSTLTLTNVQTTHTGNYTLFVTNEVGAALSSPALLNVTVPPIVTVAAADATASEPGANTGAFLLSRTGNTSRGLIVEFAVTGSAIPGGDYTALASPVLIPAGASSTTLAVNPINDSLLEGNETVVVTIAANSEYVIGSQSSATVVIFDDDNLAPSVSITNPAPGSMFNAGADITISATASDADGTVASVEFFYNVTNKIGEVTSPPYTVTWSNAPSGAHTLTAVATDDLGSTGMSDPVNIDVNRTPIVSITTPTNGASFFAPAHINITATASDADGTVSEVQFYIGTNFISSDTTSPYTATATDIPVGTYSLAARAIDNQGTPGISAPVVVTVAAAPPRFDDTFANRGVINGYTNFVTGNNSSYTKEPGEPRHANTTGGHSAWIQWIAPASGTCAIDTFGSDFDTVLAVYRGTVVSNLTFVASNDDYESSLQSRLSFSATVGVAYVIVVDGYGAPDFGNIVFHLNLPNPNPIITQHPTNQIVNQGSSVTFSIVATGPAPLRYQWFFNGNPILNATNTSLLLSNVRSTNEGSYHCVVSNASGFAVSSTATLTVRVPPSITTQPTGRTVDPGGTATFSVAAIGTAPLTYQWRHLGNPITGQTNATLVLTSVQHTNAGNYSVRVNNVAGTATSQAAELIVRPVIVSARRLDNGHFELNLNGTPGRSYTIQASTNNLAGWSALTNVTHSAVAAQHIDTTAPAHNKRYYRLRLVTP